MVKARLMERREWVREGKELVEECEWTWECGKCGREFGRGPSAKKKAEQCCKKLRRQ